MQQHEKRVVPVMLDMVWEHAGDASDVAYNFIRSLISITNSFDWREASDLVLITAAGDANVVHEKITNAVQQFCSRGYQQGIVVALFCQDSRVHEAVKALWEAKGTVLIRPSASEVQHLPTWKNKLCQC